MRYAVSLVLCGGLLAGCGGYGVHDAEQQAREGERTTPGKPGASIFTALSSSSKAIENHLSPGLGKSKDEHIRLLGQPFKCVRPAEGSEICGWRDSTPVGEPAASGDFVYYVYNERGIALEWHYRGRYGSKSNVDALLPSPDTP